MTLSTTSTTPNQVIDNQCAFCGKLSNYWFDILNCYICPSCLGEYQRSAYIPVFKSDYQTGDDLRYNNGTNPNVGGTTAETLIH
jgi:hypothetical protein